MPLIRIDGARLRDRDDFHSVFAEVFGFPSFYGRTMDAWNDCMSYVGEADGAGMTTIVASTADPAVICLDNADSMPESLFKDLAECLAFVNWRNLKNGQPAVLILACHR